MRRRRRKGKWGFLEEEFKKKVETFNNLISSFWFGFFLLFYSRHKSW